MTYEELYITQHRTLRLAANETLADRYRKMGLSYPRFFKMDNLCKLGYLCAAELLSGGGDNSRTAMIMACGSSSLDSDAMFEKTVQEPEKFFPSPSVFVYTLANVVMGELAIAYGVRGENTMFVAEGIAKANLEQWVRQTFAHSDVQKVLCGWVEYGTQKQEAVMMMIEKKHAKQRCTNENILKIYEM